MTDTIPMPQCVVDLVAAHRRMCEHYAPTGLAFTLDGKLVGDIAEAMGADAFGLQLCSRRNKAIDAHAADGRSVQIKASGKADGGPAFTPGEGVADHLLFIYLDFNGGSAEVRYNGPEAPVRALLPAVWSGTKVVSLAKIRPLARAVRPETRLSMRR